MPLLTSFTEVDRIEITITPNVELSSGGYMPAEVHVQVRALTPEPFRAVRWVNKMTMLGAVRQTPLTIREVYQLLPAAVQPTFRAAVLEALNEDAGA